MQLTLDELITIFPEQLWLNFSLEEQDKYRKQAQNYSNNSASWNAYLNLLSLRSFMTYLQDEPDLKDLPLKLGLNEDIDNLEQWQSILWEFINGTVLTIGNIKLVLIPQEEELTEEFYIPQEWIDIPDFAAHYYLPIQINLEDRWIRIWGYTTYEEVKKSSHYDPLDRTYSVSQEELTEDLNMMWINHKMGWYQKPMVKPLGSLSSLVETLLEELAQPTSYSPRLKFSFQEWGAILATPQYREKLYQKRVNFSTHSGKILTRIGEWIDRNFTIALQAGWTPELSLEFRSSGLVKKHLIHQLKTSKNEEELIHLAESLGKIEPCNPEAIHTLSNLVETTQNETNQWKAALVLGRIDPHHPKAAICCYKIIKIASHQVMLRVSVVRNKEDEMVKILLEVSGISSDINPGSVPQDLVLEILDREGNIVATDNSNRDYRLHQLSGEFGEEFTVQLVLGNLKIQEKLGI